MMFFRGIFFGGWGICLGFFYKWWGGDLKEGFKCYSRYLISIWFYKLKYIVEVYRLEVFLNKLNLFVVVYVLVIFK